MIKKCLILILLPVCLFFAMPAFAQVQSSDISLILNPAYPRANEQVKAVLSTSTTDLNRAKITWILNGNTELDGIGRKNFTFNTGDNGTSTDLEILIETADGSTINKKLSITGGDVDLLTEAYDVYVPPFYKGKALIPNESMVKMVAIPNISSKEGFTYNWTQDGDKKPGSSGYNKNYYLLKNSYLEKDNSVSVSVINLAGKTVGVGNTTIKYEKPKILFYEDDPILGIKYEKVIDEGFFIGENGATVIAVPYFMTPKDLNSRNLEYKWILGGEEIPTPSTKNILSIRPNSGQNGGSKIELAINNLNTLFLNIKKSVNISF